MYSTSSRHVALGRLLGVGLACVLLLVATGCSGGGSDNKPIKVTQDNARMLMHEALMHTDEDEFHRVMAAQPAAFCHPNCSAATRVVIEDAVIWRTYNDAAAVDIIKALLARSPDLTAVPSFRYTLADGSSSGDDHTEPRNPLSAAMKAHQLEFIRLLLNRGRFPDGLPKTALELYDAGTWSDAQSAYMARAMIADGAPVQWMTNGAGFLVEDDRLHTLKTLLDHGGQLIGDGILDWYTRSNHDPAMLQLLVQHGANVNYRDVRGLNALESAVVDNKIAPGLEAQYRGLGLTIHESRVRKARAAAAVAARLQAKRDKADLRAYCREVNTQWVIMMIKAVNGIAPDPGDKVIYPPPICLKNR